MSAFLSLSIADDKVVRHVRWEFYGVLLWGIHRKGQRFGYNILYDVSDGSGSKICVVAGLQRLSTFIQKLLFKYIIVPSIESMTSNKDTCSGCHFNTNCIFDVNFEYPQSDVTLRSDFVWS